MGTERVFSFQPKTKLFIFTRYQSSKIDIILCQNLNLVRVLQIFSVKNFKNETIVFHLRCNTIVGGKELNAIVGILKFMTRTNFTLM